MRYIPATLWTEALANRAFDRHGAQMFGQVHFNWTVELARVCARRCGDSQHFNTIPECFSTDPLVVAALGAK